VPFPWQRIAAEKAGGRATLALVAVASAAAQVWTLAASVVAVRQALDYISTGRAPAVCDSHRS
jgi:hypothetical protein